MQFNHSKLLAVQGDWGMQFGMLIQYISEAYADGLQTTTLREESISHLQHLYQVCL